MKRSLALLLLCCSSVLADRYVYEFDVPVSIDVYGEANWAITALYNPDRRQFDLWSTLLGPDLSGESFNELEGHGVDDAGRIDGELYGQPYHVVPNDFRLDFVDNDLHIRSEHDRNEKAYGNWSGTRLTFSYRPNQTVSGRRVLEGDLNFDGSVDFPDFLVLASNFGLHDHRFTYRDGDFDYDNRVDFDDFLVLADNFGQTSNAVSVPEPSTFVLLLIAATCVRWFKWSRK